MNINNTYSKQKKNHTMQILDDLQSNVITSVILLDERTVLSNGNVRLKIRVPVINQTPKPEQMRTRKQSITNDYREYTRAR